MINNFKLLAGPGLGNLWKIGEKMKTIIILFALIGAMAVLIAIGLGVKNYQRSRKASNSEYREFKDALELIQFIRSVFKCKTEHKTPMYGFVDSVFNNETLFRTGISDEQVVDVDVFLVSKKGNVKVNTTCGTLDASLKRGDFVAVLPLYNERHNFWSYVTIAKLEPVYLGKERGFLVKEQYID